MAGNTYALLGGEQKSFKEILSKLEEYLGGDAKPKTLPLINFTNPFWRWLVGQTHDKNIVGPSYSQLDLFLYYQKHDGAFAKQTGPSYFEAHSLSYKAPSFSDVYAPQQTLPDYHSPLMADYKRIELD